MGTKTDADPLFKLYAIVKQEREENKLYVPSPEEFVAGIPIGSVGIAGFRDPEQFYQITAKFRKNPLYKYLSNL